MEFLMTDGSLHKFANVISADVEEGVLVGRSPSGEFVVAFARVEVVAFGDSLQLTETPDGDRRSGGRHRS